jgi:hypothetical protein
VDLPAVWLPYGSTSISVRVDPDDLAWVVPRGLNTDYSSLLPDLKNSVKELTRQGNFLLMDPTLPPFVKDFLKKNVVENLRELTYFDLFKTDLKKDFTLKYACLLSSPHLDPLIEFRGLGESLFPFNPELWREFTNHFLETSDSGKTVDLKPYLDKLCNDIDLRLIMLAPWGSSPQVLSLNSPVEAYDALKNLQPRCLSTQKSVEILLLSAGGEPFDESLIRALSILPNCLQNNGCDRIILVLQGANGLGLDPVLVSRGDELKTPLILKYLKFCRNLLNGKNVHIVSAIPEPLLKTVLDCRAYDALLDAYKASRLFLQKGSKIGVVTHVPFTILRFENILNGA